LSYGPVDL